MHLPHQTNKKSVCLSPNTRSTKVTSRKEAKVSNQKKCIRHVHQAYRKSVCLPMFDANNVKWTGASQVNPEYEAVAMVKEMGSPRCRATCSTCAHLSLLCLRYLVAWGYELLSGFFVFLFCFFGLSGFSSSDGRSDTEACETHSPMGTR